MDLEIRWQDEHGQWQIFDLEAVYWHSRNHCIQLFSNKTPVIIREGDIYLVNSPGWLETYKESGKNVSMIQDCQPSTKSIIDVGFMDNNHRGKV